MDVINSLFHDTAERIRELNNQRAALLNTTEVEEVIKLLDLSSRIDELGNICVKLLMLKECDFNGKHKIGTEVTQ